MTALNRIVKPVALAATIAFAPAAAMAQDIAEMEENTTQMLDCATERTEADVNRQIQETLDNFRSESRSGATEFTAAIELRPAAFERECASFITGIALEKIPELETGENNAAYESFMAQHFNMESYRPELMQQMSAIMEDAGMKMMMGIMALELEELLPGNEPPPQLQPGEPI